MSLKKILTYGLGVFNLISKEGLIYGLVAFMLIFPLILTIINIINLFKKKKIKPKLFDILTFIFGIIFSVVLYLVYGMPSYSESVILNNMTIELHEPIFRGSFLTVIVILLLGFIAFFVLDRKKLNLPPLIVVICLSLMLICSSFMATLIVQLSCHFIDKAIVFVPYLALFPLNYIILSTRVLLTVLKKYKEENKEQKQYENEMLNKLNKIIYNTDNWPYLVVIFTIPIMIILICILTLFGQRPDEIIRAFLDTSDWTLSTKISPNPITNNGHYLCTVSLKGHKKIVKPIRMGIRYGEKIVVNRQLLVANAFEDLIAKRLPKFHHFIRYIYDKYGFPLSKHINTKLTADIIYILMKPLEFIFIIVLYLFETKPENSIAIQYTK